MRLLHLNQRRDPIGASSFADLSLERRECDGGQDGDDNADDHQFKQRETLNGTD